jgi:hypothetical protein
MADRENVMASSSAPIHRVENGLSASVLRLIDRLADQSQEGGMGGRKEPRYPVHGPVPMGVRLGAAASISGDGWGALCLLDERTVFTPLYRAWATDLSRNGIGLLAENILPTSAVLWANLQSLAGEPMLLPVKLIYCTQLLSHTFRAGGVFVFSELE